MITDSTPSHQSRLTKFPSRWGIQTAISKQHAQPDTDHHFTPRGRSLRDPLMRDTCVPEDSSGWANTERAAPNSQHALCSTGNDNSSAAFSRNSRLKATSASIEIQNLHNRIDHGKLKLCTSSKIDAITLWHQHSQQSKRRINFKTRSSKQIHAHR